MLHPDYPTLGFLGIVLTYGNESCVGEMQARWLLSLWRGSARCPSLLEVREHVKKVERKAEVGSPKFAQFVSYLKYMDMLARDIGCLPTSWWHINQMALSLKLLTGPVVPAQYRLVGPHRWQGAEEFVKRLPVVAGRFAELALWKPTTPGAHKIQKLDAKL
mmetsp:Transcript_120794/g.213071  ORF Transcript_120794/g.213071 Transcript_120794/m.213071 type:complete len:161 (-) Transcript_120794:13-495(-)